MAGQERSKRLDHQILGPFDCVNNQTDQPAPSPDYHKLRPCRRGRLTIPSISRAKITGMA